MWVVTARYRHSLAAGDVPWGLRHAKRVGERFTACEQLATNWPTFWTLSFEPGAPSTCQRCSAVVSEARSAT